MPPFDAVIVLLMLKVPVPPVFVLTVMAIAFALELEVNKFLLRLRPPAITPPPVLALIVMVPDPGLTVSFNETVVAPLRNILPLVEFNAAGEF